MLLVDQLSSVDGQPLKAGKSRGYRLVLFLQKQELARLAGIYGDNQGILEFVLRVVWNNFMGLFGRPFSDSFRKASVL